MFVLHICKTFSMCVPRGALLGSTHIWGFIRHCQMTPVCTPISSGWEVLSPSHDIKHFLDLDLFLPIWFFKYPVSCYFIWISLTVSEAAHFSAYLLAAEVSKSAICFSTAFVIFPIGYVWFLSFIPQIYSVSCIYTFNILSQSIACLLTFDVLCIIKKCKM